MSRYDNYSKRSIEVLTETQDLTLLRGEDAEATPKALAEAMLIFALPELLTVAQRFKSKISTEKIKALYEKINSKEPCIVDGPIKISDELRYIFNKAEEMAEGSSVEPIHILTAAWPTIRSEVVPYFEIIPESEIEAERQIDEEEDFADIIDEPQNFSISKFGIDLTSSESKFYVYGRDEEIDNVISIMLKFWKPNPLIIGESGVGKTAIVQGLAMRIKNGTVPAALKNAKIIELRMTNILAGTSLHGALEETINNIVDYSKSHPNTYFFIDEIHQIVPAFANNPISDALKPALSSGELHIIGATTTQDYAKYLEKDTAILRRFQTFLVKEPEKEAVQKIVTSICPRLEKHFGLTISKTMQKRAIDISARYLPMKYFPDKVLDLLDRACSKAAINQNNKLTEKNLIEAVKDIGNIIISPELEEQQGMPGLEKAISKNILHQDEAVKIVCEAVRVSKMRLDPREERPDGVFLFTGPTGVGKTAMALSLSQAITGRKDAFFRIDMSEFSDAHTSARLLGAPPGYIGFDEQPLLSRAVETCAGGVLILDEFEKAHPKVHRLFLQIFDAGRAVDSTGKTLSFSSMTIIATSNVGTSSGQIAGFVPYNSTSGFEAVPMSALKKEFPLELLNRFDEIVPFRALTKDDAEEILQTIVLRDANENLMKEYNTKLEFSKEAIDTILNEGYSLEFGVRNLQRAYRKLVSVPLVKVLKNAKKVINVEASNNKLVFKV